MRLVKYELLKVCKSRVFLALVLCAILLNAIFLLSDDSPGKNLPVDGYTKLHDELSALGSAKAKREYLDRRAAIADILFILERRPYLTPDDSRFFEQDPELVSEGFAQFERGDYLNYCATAGAELSLINKVISQFDAIDGFAARVGGAAVKAETMILMGIVRPENGFTYNDLVKTARDYRSLSEIPVSYDIPDGVGYAVGFEITNAFLVLCVLLISVYLFRTERDDGLWALTKPAPYGGYASSAAKLAALFILTFGASALLYGTNTLIGFIRFGFGDLSRPLQSLPDYGDCILKMSVGQYMLFFFLFKLAVGYGWALMAAFFCIVAKKASAVFLAVAAVFFSGYAPYALINPHSRFIFWKYVNIYNILDTSGIFRKYINLDIGGRAVNLMPLALIFAALFLLVFFSLCLTVYPSVRARAASGWSALRLPSLPVSRIFGFECKKLFSDRLGALLLILLAAFQVWQLRSVSFPQSANELVFKNYMLELEGPDDGSQLEFIAAEQAKIDNIEANRQQLSEDYLSGNMTSIEYRKKTAELDALEDSRRGFDMLKKYSAHVTSTGAGYYVYDRGYAYIFGQNGGNEASVIKLSLLLALGLSAVFAGEYECGAVRLSRPSKLGGGFLFRKKLGAAALFSLLAGLAVFLPELYAVSKFFPLNCRGASALSLSFISRAPEGMSITALYAAVSAVRIFGLFCAASAVFALGTLARRMSTAVLISAGVLIIPCIASLAGIGIVNYFTLLPVMSGNILLSMSQRGIGAIFPSAAAILVLVLGMAYSKRRFCLPE